MLSFLFWTWFFSCVGGAFVMGADAEREGLPDNLNHLVFDSLLRLLIIFTPLWLVYLWYSQSLDAGQNYEDYALQPENFEEEESTDEDNDGRSYSEVADDLDREDGEELVV